MKVQFSKESEPSPPQQRTAFAQAADAIPEGESPWHFDRDGNPVDPHIMALPLVHNLDSFLEDRSAPRH